MDVVKWLADTSKEAVGVNDFNKAKDAYKRAEETGNKIDYSGNTWSDIKNAAKAMPSYTKDIAVSVGDAAVGATKAAVNVGMLLVPETRADKIASKAAGLFKPKFSGPKSGPKTGITPPRQFTPKPSASRGGVGVLERPKVETKPSTATKPKVEVVPKAETAPKADTAPKTEAAPKAETKPATGKSTGRGKTFAAAAAAAAGIGTPKGDGPWTASAIV
jgi:hypothetical protein